MTSCARLVVGIAGGTGSGKTTVARNILRAMPKGKAVLLEHDGYYKDLSDLPLEDRAAVNFDHPESLESDLLLDHIRALREGRTVEKPVYDFVHHCRSTDSVLVEPVPVVLVEGILIFTHRALRDSFDIKIFVDTDADMRVLRRLQRDMAERGRSLESIIRQYYSTVRPMHLEFVEPSKRWADIIIPGGGHNEIALDLVTEKLRRFLGA